VVLVQEPEAPVTPGGQCPPRVPRNGHQNRFIKYRDGEFVDQLKKSMIPAPASAMACYCRLSRLDPVWNSFIDMRTPPGGPARAERIRKRATQAFCFK
jgi:hypothetical protein